MMHKDKVSKPISVDRYKSKKTGDILRTIQVYGEAWDRLGEMGLKEFRSRGGMNSFIINEYYEKVFKKEEIK